MSKAPTPEPYWILEVRQWLQDRDNTHAAAQSAADNAALRAELEALRKQCADEDIRTLTMTEVDDLREQVRVLREERDAALQASRWESDLCGQALEDLKTVTAERDALREEASKMKAAWESLADAAIEFAEHLAPEMSPQDAIMVGKLREAFDAARKDAT